MLARTERTRLIGRQAYDRGSRAPFGRLEAMEVRRLLSTVVVDTLTDESIANSTTSLREAIAIAVANDTIQFKSGLTGTITLGGQELLLAKSLTIAGPSAGTLSVSANNASRVITVEFGTKVVLSGLTIKQGRAGFGGGIQNTGALTLNNCVVSGNTAAGRNGTFESPSGGEGWGGGIYNFGALALNSTIVTGNAAIGGSGGYGETIGVGAPGFGGGILNGGGGSVTLTNSTLSNNKAIGGSGSDNGFAGSNGSVGQGGAIYSDGADVYVTGGTFSSNSAIGGQGTSGDVDAGTGGDANGGAIWANGDLTLKNVKFDNNAALAGDGGSVRDYYASLPGGSATGGAIYSASIEPSLTRCTFTKNTAIGGSHSGYGAGGAVYATNGLNVTESTFDSNQVIGRDAEGLDPTTGGAAYGGAISVSGGVLTIAGSTLSRNSAVAGRGTDAVYWRGYEEPAADGGNAVGGAIAVAAPAFITRSTIAGNSVKGGAGGYGYDPIYVPDGDGGDARGAGINAGAGLTLTACTIAGNTAIAGSTSQQGGGGADGQSVGGGVRADGNLVFANNLIATNIAGNGPDVSGTAASQGFNLIGKSNGSSGWIASDKRGTIASPLDPRLAPLAGNGGPTKTMALLSGSPAIDAGKAFGLTTDQRGATRPLNLASLPNAVGGDGSDIGAVELQALPGLAQTPFKSFTIGATPLTIQNEDFDNGGEGIAYHDADAANQGGNTYRAGAAVDLKTVQYDTGGVYVGFTKAGEWLEYTVNVATTGTYTIDFRLASGGAGGKFHLEVGGVDKTGALTVPNTGGWQTWKTFSKPGVQLSAGSHVLRLKLDSVGATGSVGNFNYMKFTRTTSSVVTIATSTAAHVRDGTFANQNFGASDVLEVKKSTPSWTREAYIKFDLSSVASINSAKLRVFGKLGDGGSVPIGVYEAGNTWTENAIKWSGRPAVGAELASFTVSGSTAQWYEIDLTTFLQAEKAAGRNVVTLVLKAKSASTGQASFSSDETASGPRLVIGA